MYQPQNTDIFLKLNINSYVPTQQIHTHTNQNRDIFIQLNIDSYVPTKQRHICTNKTFTRAYPPLGGRTSRSVTSCTGQSYNLLNLPLYLILGTERRSRLTSSDELTITGSKLSNSLPSNPGSGRTIPTKQPKTSSRTLNVNLSDNRGQASNSSVIKP